MKSRFLAWLFATWVLAFAPLAALADGGADWQTAWATSHGAVQTTPDMTNRTVRMLLMPSISGTHIRVKLENTMGTKPVTFSAAYLGDAIGEGADVKAGSNHALTFDGLPGLTLAAGQGAYSDAIEFKVRAFRKVSLSLHVASAGDISTHVVGLRINYSAPGNRAADVSGAGFEP
ncbi:MAG: hypothetical protein ABL900_18185, partial [Burkholderiaceae bacterium]